MKPDSRFYCASSSFCSEPSLDRTEAQRTGQVQTLEEFLAGSDLGMRCREVDPDGGQPLLITAPWAPHQYRCELHGSNGDRPVTTIVGSDDGPPEMSDVLDEVAAEAAVVETARCFEEWAVNMGFDPDSRHAERVYRAWRHRTNNLRKLLGDARYEQLLWATERL